MSKTTQKRTIAAAIGSAFAISLATAPVTHAAGNPFQMNELSNGYMVADAMKVAEAKCGANKAAEQAKANAEAKCGAAKKAAEAKKTAEGKCGEAKCGSNK